MHSFTHTSNSDLHGSISRSIYIFNVWNVNVIEKNLVFNLHVDTFFRLLRNEMKIFTRIRNSYIFNVSCMRDFLRLQKTASLCHHE